ncbi:MAG: hypothetical protein HUU20_15315 [Pirellulales bacterium]|nr:hypothetical protein [Pirellulales bacterium]
MATQSSKFSLFEEHSIPSEGRDVLHARFMLPKPPCKPRRVLFIAPLIGAGAAQSLLVFRNLTRRGCILASFEYRGHPRSTGTFELDRTVSDVRHALVWAWNYANERDLPLHGLATCFGTVPLLAQFKDEGCGVLLRTVNAASSLFRLDQILRLDDFAPFLSRHLGCEPSSESILAGIVENTIDCSSSTFREALVEFLRRMFPELAVERDRFEELQFDRVNMARTVLQFSKARYLDGIAVPSWIPCHFFFGRNDALMSLDTAAGREAYIGRVRSIIPHAQLHECEVDHFGRGPDREWLIQSVGDACERYDSIPVPMTGVTKPLGLGVSADDAASPVLD